MTTAYCVKCREKREIKDPKEVTLKNGRPAVKGTCPKCGTKVFRIGKPQKLSKVKPKNPKTLGKTCSGDIILGF